MTKMATTEADDVTAICSITHFGNWVPDCNYPSTRIQFQLLSK